MNKEVHLLLHKHGKMQRIVGFRWLTRLAPTLLLVAATTSGLFLLFLDLSSSLLLLLSSQLTMLVVQSCIEIGIGGHAFPPETPWRLVSKVALDIGFVVTLSTASSIVVVVVVVVGLLRR